MISEVSMLLALQKARKDVCKEISTQFTVGVRWGLLLAIHELRTIPRVPMTQSERIEMCIRLRRQQYFSRRKKINLDRKGANDDNHHGR